MSYNSNRSFFMEREEARARKCYQLEPRRRHDDCCEDKCWEDKCDSCCNDVAGANDRKWNALDPTMNHPFNDATVVQEAEGELKNVQKSMESIIIKDSCDIEVTTTDTQVALNVQVALQAAIALVVSISIADSNTADEIVQELNAKLKSTQVNRQHLCIENSRGVNVTTTDTDIALNIQILLQILIALVIRLDVL